MSGTMKAWVQFGFGGPEMRELREVPIPIPDEDEVLVKVEACALNRLDILQREAPIIGAFSLSHIGGMDVSGVVTAAGGADGEKLLGSNVVIDPVVTCQTCDWCRAGKPAYCADLRTIGSSRNGGFAEYVAVPVRNCISVTEKGEALRALASVPVASVTAWHGLLGVGAIQPGETVVIPGAGSGLGYAGIQIARNAGCHVVTIVSTEDKVALAYKSGADLVINRQRMNWVEAVLDATGHKGADLVWDHVGGPFLQQAIDACRIEGRVVMSGTTAGNDSTLHNTSLFHNGRKILGHGGYTREEMADTINAYQSGTLKACIDSQWAFDDYLAAEDRLETGKFFGKILIHM